MRLRQRHARLPPNRWRRDLSRERLRHLPYRPGGIPRGEALMAVLRVVVVGAGFAGLAAADALASVGPT